MQNAANLTTFIH